MEAMEEGALESIIHRKPGGGKIEKPASKCNRHGAQDGQLSVVQALASCLQAGAPESARVISKNQAPAATGFASRAFFVASACFARFMPKVHIGPMGDEQRSSTRSSAFTKVSISLSVMV